MTSCTALEVIERLNLLCDDDKRYGLVAEQGNRTNTFD